MQLAIRNGYKRCGKCFFQLNIKLFNKNTNYCRACQKIVWKSYHSKNKAIIYQKQQTYRKNNPEKEIKRKQKYRQSKLGRETTRTYKKNYYHTVLKHSPHYKMENALRRRLKELMRKVKTKKAASTFELLGCDTDFFVKYIENQFTGQMSWDNYGTYWHLDHEKPCCSYDLTKSDQQKACFHYTNLRPLLATINVRKASIDKEYSVFN
jgi:Prasinovirus endonuclease VII